MDAKEKRRRYRFRTPLVMAEGLRPAAALRRPGPSVTIPEEAAEKLRGRDPNTLEPADDPPAKEG